APDAPPMANVALLGATFGTDRVPAGLPMTLYVTLANHADAEATAELRITGDHLGEVSAAATLQANETRRVPVPLRLPTPGLEALRVVVSPSRLASAATAALVVEVQPALSVWLLADAPAPGGETLGEADFVRRALGPESG